MERRTLMLGACASLMVVALRAGNDVAPADAKAVRALIEAQLAAFASDDADKAFALAAPAIQTLFINADRFLAMVRESYPVVYRPASVSFLQPERVDGKLIQRVQMADSAGAPWIVVYELQQQADRSWRIAACVAMRGGGRST